MAKTLYSGGAYGSDKLFGDIAALNNWEVKHFYTIGYNSPFGNQPISNKEYEEGLQIAKNVASKLRRNAPQEPCIKALIARNWMQVKDTECVYAIGSVNQQMNGVLGGTGWAIAMTIWRNANIPIILFEHQMQQILEYDYTLHQFAKIKAKRNPIEFERITGIGTREIYCKNDVIKLIEHMKWK